MRVSFYFSDHEDDSGKTINLQWYLYHTGIDCIYESKYSKPGFPEKAVYLIYFINSYLYNITAAGVQSSDILVVHLKTNRKMFIINSRLNDPGT